MLILLSPAKNLDFDSPLPSRKTTQAALLSDANALAQQLKGFAPQDLSQLMGISDKLSTLNYDRYQQWQLPFEVSAARQAIFAFKGDVYLGLNAYDFDGEDVAYAQQHLRILSGLYGVLKPLDKILPYRLEMGTALANERGRNLYEFWGDKITQELNKQLKKIPSRTLVNLASNEYFKSVKPDLLLGSIINVTFKEWKKGQFKVVSFFAKKARGQMSAYIIKNKLDDVAQIKGFDWDGYAYNAELSSEGNWVFTRKQ